MKSKSAAILTIIKADEMTPSGRKKVAKWIRGQVKFFEKNAKQFGKRFTARYLYDVKKK